MIIVERVARVLAGQHYSRNAQGAAHADSAAAVVDAHWRDFADDAVAVLKSLRDPGDALGGTADAATWHTMIEAALGELPAPQETRA